MDPGSSFIMASIACGLASTCVVLSLWSFIRLSRLEVVLPELFEKLPGKRIRELEQAFDAMTDAFETHQKKNLEWNSRFTTPSKGWIKSCVGTRSRLHR